ncbi:MAG: hypothetical protein APF76_09065 [Desulfitibacter sp. BRH_c19]|nr:MAG: hypothetical protein APF76_09065 [Desulfitibacter sp. BRH_c19]
MQLKQMTEKVYVIESRTINLGLIIQGKECIIIDTGLDKTSGQKISNLILEHNFELQAIINTHGHADHFGGNQRLVKLTNVPVYSSAWEINFLKTPKLEPFSLFCGANPPRILQNKFYMGPKSPGEDISCNKDFIDYWGLDIISLPGHSLGMIGIKKDGILFVGDAYLSEGPLAKHPVPFLMDVDASIETLFMLRDDPDCNFHVNSHQGIYSTRGETGQVIEANIRRLEEIYVLLENTIASSPKTSQELAKIALDYFNADCNTYFVYQLIIVTINAYLSSLLDKQRIQPIMKSNVLYWSK